MQGALRRRAARCLAPAILLTSWLTLSCPAFAQSPSTPASAPDATPPEPAAPPPAITPGPEPVEVRVIGSKADSLQRVPGSGTLVTRQEIERADPADVGEMLRRVPGIQVREENGGGLRLDIGVRGLEAGRSRSVLVLEDGVPVSLNPYAEPDMYFSPPIERMRGIEVVKGSGSILFGPQTIGGVINFLTLAPSDHPHATVEAEGGSLGYLRGLANYGDALGGVRYIAQASYKRGDGFRSEAFNSTDVFGKAAFRTSERGEATVKIGFHDDSTDSDDVGLTRAMYAADPSHPTLAPFDHMYLRRYEASLVHEQRLGEKTKLKTLVYGYVTNRLWRRQDYLRCPTVDPVNPAALDDCNSQKPPGGFENVVGQPQLPNGAIAFTNTDTILDREYEVAGVEPKLEHRLKTGDVEQTFEIGARLLGETAHYQQRTGASPTSYSGALDAEEKHRTLAEAGYVQDRIAFRDDLLVTPGFRVEHADYHRIILRQNDTDVYSPGDTSVTGLIPGIGMIYGSRRAHVFAGLHEGWAPPRIVSAISPKGTPAQVSAEQSLNYEVGTRLTPTKWFHGELTGFLTNYQNQVITNTQQGVAASQVDAGNTRHVGVEALGSLGIGKLLGWRPIVDLGVRYTYAYATFLDGALAGNLLPYAPLHNLSANVDVEDPSGFGGQLAYLFVDKQYTDDYDTRAADATGRIGLLPAYSVVDATAHYRHRPSGVSVRLTVKNAFNDIYVVARRPEGIFASGFRTVMLALRWDYDGRPKEEP